MSPKRTLLAALAAAILVTSTAHAQQPDPAAIEQAKQHFAMARQKYDAGDKKAAVEEFKMAFKLSKNPVLLYNIAFVYDELNDKQLALHYYTKFLTDGPATHPSRQLAEERKVALTKAIADEEAAATQPSKPVEPASKPVEPASKPVEPASKPVEPPAKVVTEFEHVILEEAPPNQPIDLGARVPDMGAARLTLYFRSQGEGEFRTVRMRQRYDELVGRIPAESVRGGALQYYIEVKDKSGKLIASSGRASSPNIIFVEPTAKPHFYADEMTGSVNPDEDEDLDNEDILTKNPEPTTPPKPGRGAKFYARYGTSALAVGLLTFSVVAYATAGNYSAALEAEAYNSTHGCANPPCMQFSGVQSDYESGGQTWETLSTVSLIGGVLAAAGAGYFWFDELYLSRRGKKAEAGAPIPAAPPSGEGEDRFHAVPLITDDFIGGAAVVSF